jgi:transposase
MDQAATLRRDQVAGTHCYGHWQSVYGLYRRWQRNGTWARMLAALRARADAAGVITWDGSVDSTSMRAHQHAAGARRDPDAQKEPPRGVEDEPDDHALGRSRGGLSTNLHLACEQGQKPLSMLLTGGQRGDSPQFVPVLESIRVLRRAVVGHAPARTGSSRIRPTPLRRHSIRLAVRYQATLYIVAINEWLRHF